MDVYVTVLEAAGAELPAAVAAATAALANAGVAMRDLVSACSVARRPSGGGEGKNQKQPHGVLLLDPTTSEERNADGAVTVAHMSTVGEATQVVATGSWDADGLDEAIQLAVSGCARVDQALRLVLRRGREETAR